MLTALLALACGQPEAPEAPPAPPAATEAGPSSDQAPAAPPARADGEPLSHAIVIVIDTLRADAVDRARTPHIDALAARGHRVDRAWSAGTWTVPSVVSLMSGAPIRQHGWDLPTGKMGRYPALPALPLVAEVYDEAGFRTIGLYANGYLAEELGFDRGFDVWRRGSDRSLPRQLAEELETVGPDERLFLYLHLLGPHSALKPSEAARERWGVDPEWLEMTRSGFPVGAVKRGRKEGVEDAYRRAYHAVVEDSDAVVGELLDAVGEERLADAAIILTSDHGELLGEHDQAGHGYWVWEGLTRVPFVGVNVGALPETLSTASTPALLTGATGLEHDWPTGPRQALPLVAQREGKLALSPDGRRKGVWHPELEVYDLVADPEESHPLPELRDLERARADWEAAVPAAEPLEEEVELSEETREQLEALGYVGGEGERESDR